MEINAVMKLVQSYIRIYLQIYFTKSLGQREVAIITWDIDLLSHLMFIWLLE